MLVWSALPVALLEIGCHEDTSVSVNVAGADLNPVFSLKTSEDNFLLEVEPRKAEPSQPVDLGIQKQRLVVRSLGILG